MQFHHPREPSTEDLLGSIDKSLPFSEEIELAVIAAILEDPDNRIPELKSLIPTAAFYHYKTRTVYELLIEMWEAAAPIDFGTLMHYLRERGQFEKVGGSTVSELFTITMVPGQLGWHIDVLMGKYHLRREIHACAKIISQCQSHGRASLYGPVTAILDDAERLVRSVRDGTAAGEFKSTGDWMVELADDIDAQVNRAKTFALDGEVAIAGVSTGLTAIDERTNGYCQGHVWYVQAATNDGKTTWAIQQGLTLALGASQTPFSYYLMEGNPRDFWKRCLSHLTRINLGRIFSGELSDEEIQLLSGTMRMLGDSPFHLRHKPGFTKREILTDMRMMHRKHAKPDPHAPHMVFCIDYLQRVRGAEKFQEKHEHLVETSSMITDFVGGETIKSCAIILAQLAEDGKTAGSKAVTCDADVAMTVACPPAVDEAGRPCTKNDKWGNAVVTKKDESRRAITFGKNRVGKRGGVPVMLDFKGEIQRFS